MYPTVDALKTILIKENYVSEGDSRAAENSTHDSAGYIDYLMRHGLLTKPLLGQALGESYKLPFVDLGAHPIARQDVARIAEERARLLRIVCVKESQDTVTVATDAPQLLTNTDELKGLFPGQTVKLVYTLPEYISASFSLYESPLETRFSQIIAKGQRVAPEIVDEIIKDAIAYHASDMHFEPRSNGVVVRFRIDGSLRDAGVIPREFYENTLNRIKVESGMRIDEHYSAQDGAIQKELDKHIVDLRVSLIPTVEGEKAVMRVLGSYVQNYTFADIGLNEAHRASLQKYAARPFGMILTVGPTGSGKTTTLYSLVKMLNSSNVNITSIEDPVEYKITGVNQIQVREASDVTFTRGLRSIVRQDPDVILVGEIRDRETAEISVNAALTGHLLLSTFHANDAATAIPRLIDMGVEPFLIASTLEVVIAQRLVRKVCSNCRHGITINEALKGLADKAVEVSRYFRSGDTVYVGKGCSVCGGTGYNGRTALFEFIDMTPEMQELILTSPSTREVENLSRKQHNTSMFDDGIQKVMSGQTTVAEVLRVVALPTRAADKT
jgi:type IV pilus assembly protein PilB